MNFLWRNDQYQNPSGAKSNDYLVLGTVRGHSTAITEWLKQGIPWQDVAKNAGTSVKMLKEHYDHVSVEYHAERFEMMVELNKMDDNKELAKAVVDEMEARKKLEEDKEE